MLLLFGPRFCDIFRGWDPEKPALFLSYQNIDGYQTHDSTQTIAFSKLLLEDFKSSLNFA